MKIHAHQRLLAHNQPHAVKIIGVEPGEHARGSWIFSASRSPNLHPSLEGTDYYASPLARCYNTAAKLAKEWAASKGYLQIYRIEK